MNNIEGDVTVSRATANTSKVGPERVVSNSFIQCDNYLDYMYSSGGE